MNDELRKELETALTNTEKCREQIKSQLEKLRMRGRFIFW